MILRPRAKIRRNVVSKAKIHASILWRAEDRAELACLEQQTGYRICQLFWGVSSPLCVERLMVG